MTKLKVLFYGNCQLEALAAHLKRDPNFQGTVLAAKDFGLAGILANGSTLAPFEYRKNSPYGGVTSEVVEKVHQAWEEADVIVFQHFQFTSDERITSEFLHTKFSYKTAICAPFFRFHGYFSKRFDTENIQVLQDIVAWLFSQNLNHKEIFDWLHHEYDEKIENLKNLNIRGSFSFMRQQRRVEQEKYKLRLTEPDLVKVFEKELICTHFAHPTEDYFTFLYKQLTLFLNFKSPESRVVEFMGIHTPEIPYLHDCEFFKRTYPALAANNETKQYFTGPVTLDFVGACLTGLTENKIERLTSWAR